MRKPLNTAKVRGALTSPVVLRLALLVLAVVAVALAFEGVIRSIESGSALPLLWWWTAAAVPLSILLTVYSEDKP